MDGGGGHGRMRTSSRTSMGGCGERNSRSRNVIYRPPCCTESVWSASASMGGSTGSTRSSTSRTPPARRAPGGSDQITSRVVPVVGLDMELAQYTAEMQRAHDAATSRVRHDAAAWTSHTVIIVDQISSERKTDVTGGTTRSGTV